MFELLITYTNMNGKKTKKRVKNVRPNVSRDDLSNLEEELLKIDTPKYGAPRTKNVDIQLIEIETETFTPKGKNEQQPTAPVDEPAKEPKEPKKKSKSTPSRTRRLPSEGQIANWRSKTVAKKIVAYAREDLSDSCRVDECLRVMQQEAAFISSHLLQREESMCREVYQDFLAKIFLAEEWTPQMLAAFKPLKNLLKNNLRGQLKRSLYIREKVLRNVFLSAQAATTDELAVEASDSETTGIQIAESEAASSLPASA